MRRGSNKLLSLSLQVTPAALCSSSKQLASNNLPSTAISMNGIRQRLLHTLRVDGPSEALKRKALELEKKRTMRKSKTKDQFIVPVPESLSYLDTASMPMIVAAVGIAIFAKLLMMYDESRSQELIERRINNFPPGQGEVRMLSREEWEKVRELPPRTPFESKFSRPNSRIRTGEPLRLEDLKDWTIDVFMYGVARAEEYGKRDTK